MAPWLDFHIGLDSISVVLLAGAGLPAHSAHPGGATGTGCQPCDRVSRLVTREAGSGTREIFDRAVAPLQPEPAPAPLVELGSTTAVKAAVLDGIGPAVISHLVVGNELHSGHLRHVPVPVSQSTGSCERSGRLACGYPWSRTCSSSTPPRTRPPPASGPALPDATDPARKTARPGSFVNLPRSVLSLRRSRPPRTATPNSPARRVGVRDLRG
ncbi:MAG: hypothetical protein GEU81_16160 [Nitriliruptorales bacterium]|nr:hypothetical protein [Nitriliruptorales bacterium]